MKRQKRIPERAGRLPAAALALLLCLLLLCSSTCAWAEDDYSRDPELVIARSLVKAFGLKDDQGKAIVPRKAPEVHGRGIPDERESREDFRGVMKEYWMEPDYRGIVGYMSLQTGWEVSQFDAFSKTPWELPVYEPEGEEMKVSGTILHKTPVMVVDQRIHEEKGSRFRGWLQVIRLDEQQIVWIDVGQFVTVPYWTLSLEEAMNYGYCVAVYRDRSRYEPMDRKHHRGSLPEGIRVLMCDRKSSRYFSPEKGTNPLLGIVFRNSKSKGSSLRTFLFFNPEDLTLVY